VCLQTFQNKNKTQPIILTVNTTHTPNQTQTQPTTTNPNPNQAQHSTHTYLLNEAPWVLKEAILEWVNVCCAMVPSLHQWRFICPMGMGWEDGESDARGVHQSWYPPPHLATRRSSSGQEPPRGGRAPSPWGDWIGLSFRSGTVPGDTGTGHSMSMENTQFPTHIFLCKNYLYCKADLFAVCWGFKTPPVSQFGF